MTIRRRLWQPVLMLIGCGAILLACAPINIEMDQPEPFSSSLEAWLSEGRADKARVHEWLGAPSGLFLGGQVEVYVAQREISRQVPRISDAENRYHYHYLVVEYNSAGEVTSHEIHVNAGCTGTGLCLVARPCPARQSCMYNGQWVRLKGDASELLADRVKQLVVYGNTLQDDLARSPPPPHKCRIYLDRNNDLPYTEAALEEQFQAALPGDGYMMWDVIPGTHKLYIRWSDWARKFQNLNYEINCPAGEARLIHIGFKKIKSWGWVYDVELTEVANKAIARLLDEKVLVLQNHMF